MLAVQKRRAASISSGRTVGLVVFDEPFRPRVVVRIIRRQCRRRSEEEQGKAEWGSRNWKLLKGHGDSPDRGMCALAGRHRCQPLPSHKIALRDSLRILGGQKNDDVGVAVVLPPLYWRQFQGWQYNCHPNGIFSRDYARLLSLTMLGEKWAICKGHPRTSGVSSSSRIHS